MARPKKKDDGCGQPQMSKQACILVAAQAVFLESGYAAASMDAVASRANVSKATIYAHFENKRALFEAMIRQRCERIFERTRLPDSYASAFDAIHEIASNFLNLIMAPEALNLHRVVISEAARLPEVGEAFYSVGPVMARAKLEEMFADLSSRGLMSIPEGDEPLVTDLFIGMLKGDMHLRAVLQLPPKPGMSIERVATATAEMLTIRYPAKLSQKA